jgi:hypothetical protein
VRRIALVGVIAVLAAVGLGWWVTPDRGEVPTAPPVRAPAVAGDAPVERPVPRSEGARRGAIEPPAPRAPAPWPETFVDPNDVLEPNQQGIAAAAMVRRDRLLGCWEEHRPPGATRLTLRFTLTDAGEGAGAAAVDVPAFPDALGLHQCLNDAFADARFVTPGEVAQTVLWPVPLPP